MNGPITREHNSEDQEYQQSNYPCYWVLEYFYYGFLDSGYYQIIAKCRQLQHYIHQKV